MIGACCIIIDEYVGKVFCTYECILDKNMWKEIPKWRQKMYEKL